MPCDSWSGAMCNAVRSPVQDPRPPHRQPIRPYSGRVGAGRGAAGSRWRRLPPRPSPAGCVDLIDWGLLCAVDAAVTSPTTRLQPCHGRLFEGRMRRRQRARSRADLAGGGHPGPHHSGAPGGSRSSPRSPLQPSERHALRISHRSTPSFVAHAGAAACRVHPRFCCPACRVSAVP